MEQTFDRRKGYIQPFYRLPVGYYGKRGRRTRRIASFRSKPMLLHNRLFQEMRFSLEPMKMHMCVEKAYPQLHFRNLEILELEKQLLGKSLQKSSLELCSKLRSSIGLPAEFEADATALTKLDGFMADLGDRKISSDELVRRTRRRL